MKGIPRPPGANGANSLVRTLDWFHEGSAGDQASAGDVPATVDGKQLRIDAHLINVLVDTFGCDVSVSILGHVVGDENEWLVLAAGTDKTLVTLPAVPSSNVHFPLPHTTPTGFLSKYVPSASTLTSETYLPVFNNVPNKLELEVGAVARGASCVLMQVSYPPSALHLLFFAI